MGKIGFNKGQNHLKKVNNRTTNQAGGKAFSAKDPVTRLIGSAAAWMGGEPGFYPDKVTGSRSLYNKDVLDQRGIALVDTAIEIATGSNPEDLLIVANWIRNDMRMRTVSVMLLAVAAKCITGPGPNNTENPVTRYVPSICTRADDILQLLAFYNALFGKKKNGQLYARARLPKPLQKGMAYAMNKQSFYNLLKWNSRSHPSFADVLGAIRHVDIPKEDQKDTGFPLHQGMYRFLMDGTIQENAPKILRARKKFLSLNPDNVTINEELLELAREAGMTWENINSHFGTLRGARKAQLWSLNIKQMGYMARLRNLRNFLDNGVDDTTIRELSDKLADPAEVRKSKQLPFRFLSAVKAVEQANIARATSQYVIENLYEALDVAVEGVEPFTGTTAVFVDISGSMDNLISSKSTLNMREVAAILGAIIYKRNKGVVLYAFAEKEFPVKGISRRDSVMTIARKILGMNPKIGATWTHESVYALERDNIKVDRAIYLTDEQAYGNRGGSYSYWSGRRHYGHHSTNPYNTVEEAVNSYRKNINKQAFFHFINLQGYEQSSTPVQGDPYTNQIAGFSEKLIGLLASYEDGVLNKTTGKVINNTSKTTPTINDLRTSHALEPGAHRRKSEKSDIVPDIQFVDPTLI